MTRVVAWCHVALTVSVVGTAPAFAQLAPRSTPSAIRQLAATSQGEVKGTVLDDRGQPLVGAVVSAVGATSAFAVTERDGTFIVRNLPAGPYLIRVHLQGYTAPRSRMVQVNGGALTVPAITLAPRVGADRQVLEAGIGAAGASGGSEASEPTPVDRSEVAWRLRHLKRSVLKDVDPTMLDAVDEPVVAGWGAVLADARSSASAGWFGDLPFSGQVDLLTSTSFDRPQDLLSLDVAAPSGVTSFALALPMGAGEWQVRGGLTQGDIASWLASSAFTRRDGAHQLEAGVSYGAQRYLGGNAFLMGALSDGSRNVGEVYVADRWTLNPNIELSYGAKYARYDYLTDRALLSPTVSVVLTPPDSSFSLNASASRREIAPGAEEFLMPGSGLWLPPQRTFSALGGPGGFERERIDNLEVRAEKQFAGDMVFAVRAFKQQVDGQTVTLFGLGQADSSVASVGHYYVASVGDFDARGWGVSLSHGVVDGVKASIGYTMTDADWVKAGADTRRLARLAPSTVRADAERMHDVRAAVESQVPQTLTRVLVVYKVNTGFASNEGGRPSKFGTRFDVQVNQALPFLNFAASQWEALVAVRNMFRDDLANMSVYDELLVVKAPTRIVGGLSVRF